MSHKLKNQADHSVADRLITAAELLYGKHGVEGASLRQISTAAGTGNNYAVQYHFGDAAGLIRAIISKRLPLVEMERAKRLAMAAGQGTLDVRTLVDVLTRPLIDQFDKNGHRSLARFVLAVLASPGGTKHLAGFEHIMPVTVQILELLHAAAPEIPPTLLRERLRITSLMILTSVFNRLEPFGDGCDAELIDDAMNMAARAITAPVGDTLQSKSRKFAAY